MSKKYQANYRLLSRETGHDRATLTKWLGGHNLKNKRETLAFIAEHEPNAAPDARDPASGLSWFQASQREDALRKRRANEEQEAVQSKRWMLTEDVFAMLRAAMNRIEQHTGKVKSEAGLTDAQAAVVQKNIDEYRDQLKADIEMMKPAA